MDDGFQNPAIEKDAAVLVVDGARGIGNGLVTPAGPLRAPLAAQLKRADALIVIGDGPGAAALPDNARAETIPLFRARLEPEAVALATLRQGRVLAFAGIGSPDKFFATLAAHGVEVARRHGFPDHHAYTRAEAQALCAEAAHEGLILATTEKDMVRMLRDPATGELAARAKPLPVTLRFDDEAGLLGLLRARIARRRGA
jgi:tetraacyldisaccharide 4'-kinase